MEIQYQPQAWTRVRFKGVALNHVKNPDNAPEPIRTQLVEFRTKLNALGFCVHDPKQSGLDVTAQILPIWFVYAFYACIWGALFLYGYAVFTYKWVSLGIYYIVAGSVCTAIVSWVMGWVGWILGWTAIYVERARMSL
jgi:hypothetical protein